MGINKNKCCSGGPNLIFACSGAADVGEISDLAARNLARAQFGFMSCLAGLNKPYERVIEATGKAGKIAVIDGCSENCGKVGFEKAGITNFRHFMLGDLGFEKGHSPVTPDKVKKVVDTVSEYLND